MQSLTIIILLVLLHLGTLALSAPNIYYVRPDIDDNEDFYDDCPPVDDCFTFDGYVYFTNRYFTSRSIFVFLAGNHTLQYQLNLEGVSDITLTGDSNLSTDEIVCKLTHNIVLDHAFNIKVKGLTFLLY